MYAEHPVNSSDKRREMTRECILIVLSGWTTVREGRSVAIFSQPFVIQEQEAVLITKQTHGYSL
jgi:hypothetical protein